MFTGIIERMGRLAAIEHSGSNVHFQIESDLSPELKADQSVAHDGVCLTVTETGATRYSVTAISETLAKTALSQWRVDRVINLERAMTLGARLDGHLVQGHVDGTGTCLQREENQGSTVFTFSFPESFAALLVEKGSVCVNGVSLTAFDVARDTFRVAIIPYTLSHTNFKDLKPDDLINIEFDLLGKYILRQQQLSAGL